MCSKDETKISATHLVQKIINFIALNIDTTGLEDIIPTRAGHAFNMFKKILIALIVIFILIQFYRPARNHSGEKTHDISTKFPVPDSAAQVLAVACNDCHSNDTRYPRYAEVQLVNYWLSGNVKDGKRHLNFNNFTAVAAARQFKRMDDCLEQIDNGEMPLESYTWIHKDAIHSPANKAFLKGSFQSIKDSLKARFPADSLMLPKRKPVKK